MSLANMLKLGQVYLNDGTWHGTRIVSESWVKQASGKQIDTPYSNIWTCGYGYQFWMSPYEGAYRADGAYGQITTVCRSRVWLSRFNARNLAISTISFVLLCMSICCFRLLPERTTFAHTVV